ncbi:MAG: insulinase family protein, partial [Bacteroidales bacterium]|nr:insulinase family protein [Bacteroidales bacterium]
MIDRTTQPEFKNIDDIDVILPSFFPLDNGSPVYYFHSDNTEISRIELIFDAGNYYETENMLIPSVTCLMLQEGSRKFTSEEISEIFDSYGARINFAVDNDCAFISLQCLRKHISSLLPVLFEIINNPVFSEKELQILLNKKKTDYLLNNEKTQYIARNKINEALFGIHHPYGKPVEISDFSSINNKRIEKFYNKYYYRKPFKVLCSGKIDAVTLSEINNIFGAGNINTQPGFSSIKYEINPCNNKTIHVSKPGAVQTSIRLGTSIINSDHPDYFQLKILSTLLGGYFGSRLMKNIREEKGYTYGINSAVLSYKNADVLIIMTDTANEYCKKTIIEVENEFKLLGTVDVDKKE